MYTEWDQCAELTDLRVLRRRIRSPESVYVDPAHQAQQKDDQCQDRQ